MASEPSKKPICTLCDKVGLKPFTKENIFNYYIPLHGVASYAALAVNVMNPAMVSRFVPKKDMSNILLLSTAFGTAVYVYGRPHLRGVSEKRRGFYAILGGTLFSMGSVLVWAIMKSALPRDNATVATLAGLASGALMLRLSADYFEDCDKLVAKD